MGNTLSKPGYKTTEFYVAIIANVVGILVILGYLTPQQADDFVKAVSSVIAGVVIIASTGIYIWGRVKLKQKSAQLSTMQSTVPGIADDEIFASADESGKYVPTE